MRRLVTKTLALACLMSMMAGCMTQQVKPHTSGEANIELPKPIASRVVVPEDVPRMQAVDAAMQDFNYKLAATLAEELLEEYPRNASLHINLGVIDLRQERFEQALSHFEQGCKLDPRNIHCPLFKGQTLLALARYNEAEAAYLRALALDSTSLYAHYGLGVIYDLYLMKYDRAEEHYQAFIDGAGEEAQAADVKRVKIWKRLLKRKQS